MNVRLGQVLAGGANPRRIGSFESRQDNKKKAAKAALFLLVGVSGFEPEASWTRTKRDTKLRHTPLAKLL